MNLDNSAWLNLVAVKLYKVFLAGINFKAKEYYWMFNWDDDLTKEQNLVNVAAEDSALTTLTQMGVIKSISKDNFYRSQQLESFADPIRGHVIWSDWEDFDPAKREYEYIRIIDDLHWDKFLSFCKEYGINYKDDKITATIEIINQRPIVRANGKEYTMKVLKTGKPLEIIEKTLAHPGEKVTFDKMRQWTGKPKVYHDKRNFIQIFRKNEFGDDNVLHPFVEIQSNAFILKGHALLTPQELSSIQKLSTN